MIPGNNLGEEWRWIGKKALSVNTKITYKVSKYRQIYFPSLSNKFKSEKIGINTATPKLQTVYIAIVSSYIFSLNFLLGVILPG